MKPGQHRETARVLLRNPQEEIFLIKTHFDPEVRLPPRWLTPGGGVDHGETVAAAAVRELYEETGLRVTVETLGEPLWHRAGSWQWGDGMNHHTYLDHIFLLNVTDFELDDSNWTDEEHRDILQHRWWNLDELIASGEPVSPPGILEALRNHRF